MKAQIIRETDVKDTKNLVEVNLSILFLNKAARLSFSQNNSTVITVTKQLEDTDIEKNFIKEYVQ